MFIPTAHQLAPIPPALRDRMEVIELSGYTEEEKLEISRRHLVPKQIEENGLTSEQISLQDEAITKVIEVDDYGSVTKEKSITVVIDTDAHHYAAKQHRLPY